MSAVIKGDLIEKYHKQKEIENYFRQAGSIENDKQNQPNIELLINLYKNNNNADNISSIKEDLKKFLEFKKTHDNGSFMYQENNTYRDRSNVINQTFNDNGNGIQISGQETKYSNQELEQRGKFDYRITLRNSDKITDEEAIAFINTLVKEANNRNLNIRAKNYWEQDALILYCDTQELENIILLLEDLSKNPNYGELVNNATKHFGPRQPFSITPATDSYYGISMAHCELEYGKKPTYLSGTYGQAINTFNSYMDNMLNTAYNDLLNKYNGNKDRITVEEIYQTLVDYHKKYMLGDKNSNESIPLWMNRRNYNELKELYNKKYQYYENNYQEDTSKTR